MCQHHSLPFTCSFLPQPCKVDTIVSALHIRKPRCREVKYLTQGCVASYWVKWGSLLVTHSERVDLRWQPRILASKCSFLCQTAQYSEAWLEVGLGSSRNIEFVIVYGAFRKKSVDCRCRHHLIYLSSLPSCVF